MKTVITRHRRTGRGQGMAEYLMILAVILAVVFGAMALISQSASTMVNTLVTHIQSVTGVPPP